VSQVPSGLPSSGSTLLSSTPWWHNQDGVLFAVNPSTGHRSILSDFGDLNRAYHWELHQESLVASDGVFGPDTAIYVVDNNAGTDGHGLLTKIDPKTGYRTVFSDFGNSAQVS